MGLHARSSIGATIGTISSGYLRTWCVVHAMGLVLAGATPLTAQSGINCLSKPGLTMTGCTAFGWGEDNTLRNTARTYLQLSNHVMSPFCMEVWEQADDWLAGFMTGIFQSATQGGESLSAVSALTLFGNWHSGWLGPWFRNTNISATTRASYLKDTALHQGGHKVCRGGDHGCSPSTQKMKSTLW